MAGFRSDPTSVLFHYISIICNKKWEWQGKMHLCWLVCRPTFSKRTVIHLSCICEKWTNVTEPVEQKELFVRSYRVDVLACWTWHSNVEVFLNVTCIKGKNAFTSIIVPPTGQFAPNLAESLWMTSGTIDLSLMFQDACIRVLSVPWAWPPKNPYHYNRVQ